MRNYVVHAAAGALLLAACEEHGPADGDGAVTWPATDSAQAPVGAGLTDGSTATSPTAGTSGGAGGMSGAIGSGAVSWDAGSAAAGATADGGASGTRVEAGTAEGGAGIREAGASTGDSSTADGSVGGCVKGQTRGSEVVVIGDSFIAINHAITNQVQSKARAAGALGPSDRYRDLPVSGTTLANNQIPGQYASAVRSSPVKVVLMNGGGNDCLQRNDSAGALSAATTLLENMGQNQTEHVVYFFYPDPAGLLGGGSLKSCLDQLRPQIESLCARLTKPKCYFIDLRKLWQPSYAMADGIHPTQQGGAAVGDEVWRTMQEHCVAQ